jgi:transcriptional regulator with XRE-family HTH domain
MKKTKKQAKYPNTGLRLKAIRESLKMTLDQIRRPVGISAGYISDFERGFKLPTVKYLKHLHDRLNVNIDYVFGSSNEMFRVTKEEKPAPLDFGKYQDDVNEMLQFMKDVPHSLFSMMIHFTEYKTENEGFIKKYLATKEDQE